MLELQDQIPQENESNDVAAEREGLRDRLTKAAEALIRKKGGAPGRSPVCLSLRALRELAVNPLAAPTQSLHLRLCRACRIALAAAREELGVARDEGDMCSGIPMVSMTAAADGGTVRQMLVEPVLSAIRNALTNGSASEWTLDGSWGLLEYLKKYASELASAEVSTRRRLAADYADLVVMAPKAMKVVLVYGLIRLRDARRFAMTVTHELARRDDALAHRVMRLVLQIEAPELKAIDCEEWRVVESGVGDVDTYVTAVDDAIGRFREAVKLPHPLSEAVDVLRAEVEALAGRMCSARDAESAILHLLEIRAYLAAVAKYVRETHSDLIECFPELAAKIHESARRHSAALFLAMEACEKLRIPLPSEMLLSRLIDFEKLPESSQETERWMEA